MHTGTETLPSAVHRLDEIAARAAGKRLALFLDYDGTLTPIVDRPEDAVLASETRALLQELARAWTVAVVSGRDLDDVRTRVGLNELYYAGSHGFNLSGPGNLEDEHEHAKRFLPILDRAQRQLEEKLGPIAGAQVERKRFAIAIHYRRVRAEEVGAVEAGVDVVRANHPELRKATGKKIFELRPDIEWDKGKAVLWLLETLRLDGQEALAIYIGDDVTDEDSFHALRGRGISIVVRDQARPTAAGYCLESTEQVPAFLRALADRLRSGAAG
jgi:trehalose-phosphatase